MNFIQNKICSYFMAPFPKWYFWKLTLIIPSPAQLKGTSLQKAITITHVYTEVFTRRTAVMF